ncbi:MAG: alpha/beta fold hydrolase [Steroidobacteraceae bacterium]
MACSRHGWACAFGIILLAWTLPAATAGTARPPEPSTLEVGSLTLHRCETEAPWCGTLVRRLDPAGMVPGTLSIYFEYYPHSAAGSALGTLVATEGGPGFPATESRREYLSLFGPLQARRDVLLMDNRGTGRSGAIDCEPLQTAPTLTQENVARCGRSLGPKAALYSAAFAADDLAAILDALRLGPIDLYGDSYGTFFEQVFAVRHPEKLRSIVLDGAYPLGAPDYAWYPNYAPAMRAKFNLACQRSAACSRLPGTSLDHIAPALQALRHAPSAAQALDGDGKLRRFTANATQLAIAMFGSAPAYATVRELDAAARAFVAADRAPLLRLMAETQVGVDSRDETRAPSKFSAGLAAAAMCQDAPQIFDMRLHPGQRIAERDRAIMDRKHSAADTYAPFTIDEYRGMPLDYAFIDECVSWPVASTEHPAAQVASGTAAYPDVPALIISGDLDNMTPIADGALVAKRFARGRQLIVPNGFHVNALPHSRSACPADIVRRFIQTLDPGDIGCLRSIAEVRLLPVFAKRIHELAPARALPGNSADHAHLRAVSGAVFTVADVIDRIDANTAGTGPGLRGGTFTLAAAAGRYLLTLHEVRWTEDLAVSGTIHWPGRSGAAQADLAVKGPGGMSGSLQVHWIEGAAQARAQVAGELGNARVVAETPAP